MFAPHQGLGLKMWMYSAWQRKTSGGGKIGYIKDLEMKMVDISIVRYENVDTLWWSVKI